MLLFYNILYTFIKSLGIYTVYSRQDMEATDRWMDKEDVIHTHTHNGILLRHKKEWNNAICSNMGGPRDYHTKSEREWQILYDVT